MQSPPPPYWPPPVYWVPPAAFSPSVPRPGWTTSAAIILIASGSVFGFMTLLILLTIPVAVSGAGMSGGLADPSIDPKAADQVGRAIVAMSAVVGMVGIIWTAGHLAAGIGALRRRGWARVLGIVLSALGATLFLLLCALVLSTLAMYSDPAFRETLLSDPEIDELYRSGAYGDPVQAAIIGTVTGAVMVGLLGVTYLCALYGLVRSAAYFAWRPPSPSPAAGGVLASTLARVPPTR